MANHYAHFITDDDLDALYCYGITHVRVPVAYWMVLPDHSRRSACMQCTPIRSVGASSRR
jgi:aryl-phospho-beta-D-glucosidase BglC (GH1 family)